MAGVNAFDVTTVVVVEDHPAMRAGLRCILEDCDDIAVVGEAATGADALALTAALCPRVVLLDIGLPDTDGIALLPQIVNMSQATKVVMLTCQGDACSVRLAIEAGASGYLSKASSPAEILDAVHQVGRGGVTLSATVATHLVSALRERNRSEEPRLTAREREVWLAMSEGLSNLQIGQRLFISNNTVKYHVHNVLAKLGCVTRAEAICAAHHRGESPG